MPCIMAPPAGLKEEDMYIIAGIVSDRTKLVNKINQVVCKMLRFKRKQKKEKKCLENLLPGENMLHRSNAEPQNQSNKILTCFPSYRIVI